MKKILLFVCCLASIVTTVSAAGPVLVENGIPKASIVIAENATRSAQLGALELQHVIRLITGAELPILTEPAEAAGTRLFVGPSEGASALGLDAKSYIREQYEVRTFPDAVVMIGNDDPDTGKVRYDQASTFPASEYSFHSTLYAVYDFLEKACGVRFYMPGDLGTCFTPRKTLIPEELNVRREPSMPGMRFTTMGVPWGKKHVSTARDRALLGFRWRMSMLYGQASHNTYGLFYRYWKKSATSPAAAEVFVREEKDLFAKGYEGKYAGGMPFVFPDDPDLPPNLCYSCEKLYPILADQAVRTKNGEKIKWTAGGPALKDMPYTYPMLGEDNSSYCRCPECRRMVPEGVEGNNAWTWLYFGFINRLCREAAKRDPSLSIAAGVYQCPIQDVPLEKNMSLQLMFGIGTWYLEGVRNKHMEIYDFWRKKAGDRPVTLWLYLLSPYWDMLQNDHPKKFFPGFYPHAVIPIARMFNRDGIQGWFAETFIDFSYLESWLSLMICYDNGFPAEKELDMFYENFFGAAAEPMRAYWKEIEDAFWNPDNYPPSVRSRYTGVLNIWTHTDDVNWGVGTAERVQKLDRLFRDAQKAAVTPLEKERLAFIAGTVHDQMIEGRKEYEARAAVRNKPLPEMTIPAGGDFGGDPVKADFSGSVSLTIGRDLFDKPVGTKITVRLFHDGKYLYIAMTEENPAKEKIQREDIWQNNMEIFAGNDEDMPYNHMVMSPQGTFVNYLHSETNGIVSLKKVPLGEKYVSSFQDGKWSFRLAVPLDRISPCGELKPGMRFRINLMRTRSDAPNMSWSPLFNISYLGGLHRRGKALLAE